MLKYPELKMPSKYSDYNDVTIHLMNVSTKTYPTTKYIKQYTHLKSGNTAVKMKYKLSY